MRDPGLEIDLFINADTVAVHKVWMGMTSLAGCIDDGQIEIDGLSSHVKAFPDWFKLSVFSDIEQAVISA